MNGFLQFMSTVTSPGLMIIVLMIILFSSKTGWMGQFISALNLFTTPWIAILVIVLGMIFDLKCKAAGLSTDSANQIIGAGIGLLTGRAIADRQNPQLPAEPAQTK